MEIQLRIPLTLKFIRTTNIDINRIIKILCRMINNQTFGMQNQNIISTNKSRISQKEFTTIQMMLRYCMLLSKMRKWEIIIIVIHFSIIYKTIESSLIYGSGGTPIDQTWGSLKETNVEISFRPVLRSRLVIHYHSRTCAARPVSPQTEQCVGPPVF